MLTIILFLFGTYELELVGINVERFLNLCAKQNIVLWDLHIGDAGYRCSIRKCNYESICEVGRKTSVKVLVKGKRGLPFFLYRHKKRKALFVGFVCFIFLFIGLSKFVWNIEVKGNETFKTKTILQFIHKNGYHIGSLKSSIDCNSLEEKIREAYPKIAWVSCSLKGTDFQVELKESLDHTTKQNIKKPCDIISNRSGTVTKLSITRGTPLVRVGSKVKCNDTLISGLIYYYSDDYKVTQTDKISANGTVILRTKEVFQEKIPIAYYQKNTYKTKHQLECIQLLQFKIPIPVKEFRGHVECVRKKYKLCLWKHLYLPLSIDVKAVKLYHPKRVIVSQSKGKQILETKKKQRKMQLEKKGIVIRKESIKFQKIGNYYRMYGYFTVEEPVGKIRNIKNLTKKQEKYITPTTAQPNG